MKCPRDVPLDVFEYLIDNEILSLSFLIRKFKINKDIARKILMRLSKLFEFVDYDYVGPIRIKTCEKPKKSMISSHSKTMCGLDEYLKTMCETRKPSKIYEDVYIPLP